MVLKHELLEKTNGSFHYRVNFDECHSKFLSKPHQFDLKTNDITVATTIASGIDLEVILKFGTRSLIRSQSEADEKINQLHRKIRSLIREAKPRAARQPRNRGLPTE